MTKVNTDPSELLRAGRENVFDSLDERRAFAAVSENLLGRPEDPATLDRFQIRRRVGSGGMGVVYAAHDPKLGRKVALKLLKPERSSAKDEERLIDEAKALARLNHPNIVGIHEVGTVDGRVFIAMELIEGVPLSTWLTTRPTWQEVARVALQAGRGLMAAHKSGVVHRDFKPANVMLREDGRVVVLDFGLARMHDSVPTQASTSRGRSDSLNTEITASSIAGTPAYMAPEQHLGRAASALSDQFAFCVSFYEALYGQRPFEAPTRLSLLREIDNGRFRPLPKSRRVSARLRRTLMRGVRAAPADRWPSMEVLLAEIDSALRAPRRRGQLLLLSGAVALAGSVALASMPNQAELCTQADIHFVGLWDAEVRNQLDTRYAGSIAWPNLRARIEAGTSKWKSRWQDTCKATHIHGSQSPILLDQRMACLDADRVALGAAVHLLKTGERALIQRAVRLDVFDRDGKRCETDDFTRRTPVPASGPERERYDEVRRVAAEQYAQAAIAGFPKRALAVLDELDVGPQTHPDVVREVEHARAEAYRQLNQPKQAYAAWQRAARAADLAGDDVSFVSAASILAFVDAEDLHRMDAANVWLERARSRAEATELPHQQRFGLALRGAVVTRFRGEPEAAAMDLESLLETEGNQLSADDEGTLRHNLAELYAALRRLDDAAEQYELAIALRSSSLGEDHRQVGQSRFLLGQLLIEQGQVERADVELQAAATIFANVEGGEKERIMVEGGLGVLAAMRNDLPLADRRLKSTIELAGTEWGPEALGIAVFLVNDARVLMMMGKLEEAAAQLQRGLDLETKALGPEDHRLAGGLSLFAEIRLAQGRPVDAERLARRAAAVASAPDLKLAHKVAAIMWHGHAICDAAEASAEVSALLDSASEGTSPDTMQALRGGLEALASSIAEYPTCKVEPDSPTSRKQP
ncbi:MAG: serine/threonine-protein kinase [Nannocystaceae bacterium]|nr:serine/threonine-protein kinase [Nannocystaceae bacterium]